MQARMAAQMPNAVAHVCKADGYQSWKTAEVITMMMKWATQRRTTVRASRQEGGGGEVDSWCSGAGVGKKMRKRSIL